MAPDHEKKDKRRGPIRKSDKLELPEEQTESAGAESSGDQAASGPPKSTPPTDTEPQSVPETSPSPSQATCDDDLSPMQQEAKASAEDKGKHPYSFQVNNAPAVPFALRDPMNGNPSRELIEDHLQYCWNIGATPVITGVMIGERVK